MKKFAIIVGLTAMLTGCGGGGGDCEEGTVTPPVTEVSFPNGQMPEYVIRTSSEIESRNSGVFGQVVGMEVLEDGLANVTIQRFDADYSNGYQTKPTSNVIAGQAVFYAKIGGYEAKLTSYDLNKLSKSLPTVAVRGDVDGAMRLELALPVMGELQELNSNSVRINNMDYKLGTVDDGDGGNDVYVGRWVAGMFDGDKLNVISLSVTEPVWGFLMVVEVDSIIGDTDFTYITSDGATNTVFLNERPSMMATDRVMNTDKLEVGKKVLIQAFKLDYVTQNANVYKAE